MRDDTSTAGPAARPQSAGDWVRPGTANTANSASPTGPAGGDLTGDYPNPSIADNSVNSAKIADAQVRAADLGAITQVQLTGNVAANSAAHLTASCPAGTRLITGGGGINLLGPPANVQLTATLRIGNSWRAIVRNDTAAQQPIFVQVQCLES